MFVPQMANHVAPWEDENGWTHSNCPVGYNFPEMLCNLSRYLGHPQCPEYAAKIVTENETQVYQVYIHLAPHPERAQYLQETVRTLREAYELVTTMPLRSCAKGIRHNWRMLQPHSCLSMTRQICLGGFGISKC